MPLELSAVLPDDAHEARQTFLEYLADPGRGLLVTLGADQQVPFAIASDNTLGGPELNVSALWAKNPDAIMADIKGLEFGNRVKDTHKMVAINKLSQVSKCLNEQYANSDLMVTTATACAARNDGPCDH